MDFHQDAYTLGSEAALELFFKEAANFTQMLGALRPRAASLKTPLSPHTVPQGAFGADPGTVAAMRKARPAVPAPSPTMSRVTTGSAKTAAALGVAGLVGLGAGGVKGYQHRSDPMDAFEGAARGAGGAVGGGFTGTILGAMTGNVLGTVAGKLLGLKPNIKTIKVRGMAPGPIRVKIPGGAEAGSTIGALTGLGIGGASGYKSLTRKYDE